jgi:hypothetical protein
MRFTRSLAAALLYSAVSVSVSISAQATYRKGKSGINRQDAAAQYIPGRFIVEFSKPDGFHTAEDVSAFFLFLLQEVVTNILYFVAC